MHVKEEETSICPAAMEQKTPTKCLKHKRGRCSFAGVCLGTGCDCGKEECEQHSIKRLQVPRFVRLPCQNHNIKEFRHCFYGYCIMCPCGKDECDDSHGPDSVIQLARESLPREAKQPHNYALMAESPPTTNEQQDIPREIPTIKSFCSSLGLENEISSRTIALTKELLESGRYNSSILETFYAFCKLMCNTPESVMELIAKDLGTRGFLEAEPSKNDEIGLLLAELTWKSPNESVKLTCSALLHELFSLERARGFMADVIEKWHAEEAEKRNALTKRCENLTESFEASLRQLKEVRAILDVDSASTKLVIKMDCAKMEAWRNAVKWDFSSLRNLVVTKGPEMVPASKGVVKPHVTRSTSDLEIGPAVEIPKNRTPSAATLQVADFLIKLCVTQTVEHDNKEAQELKMFATDNAGSLYTVAHGWALASNFKTTKWHMPHFAKNKLNSLYDEGKSRNHAYTAEQAMNAVLAMDEARNDWEFASYFTMTRVKQFFAAKKSKEKEASRLAMSTATVGTSTTTMVDTSTTTTTPQPPPPPPPINRVLDSSEVKLPPKKRGRPRKSGAATSTTTTQPPLPKASTKGVKRVLDPNETDPPARKRGRPRKNEAEV